MYWRMLQRETLAVLPPGSIFCQWHPSLWRRLLNVRSLMASLLLGVDRQHWTVLWRCIKLDSLRSTTLKSWDTWFSMKVPMNLLKVMHGDVCTCIYILYNICIYVYGLKNKESAKWCWESFSGGSIWKCIIIICWSLSFVEKGLGVETERVPRVETERGMLGSL